MSLGLLEPYISRIFGVGLTVCLKLRSVAGLVIFILWLNTGLADKVFYVIQLGIGAYRSGKCLLISIW